MNDALIGEAARMARAARRPLVLAGGGAKAAGQALRTIAERLGAPVVTTANARGLMHEHPLGVPASPSLRAMREMIADADLVIAAGTEFGPTDYDMYADGGFVSPANLIRIDIDAAQLQRHPATLAIEADCADALSALGGALSTVTGGGQVGASRAAAGREQAWAEIGLAMQEQVRWVEAVRDALPGSLIVGDSTQPVYAANLFYDHDRAGGWFNAATGYGALGYGPAAAIGAAIALPGAPVVCLTGDGGFQFTLPEIGAALDAGAAVIFLVWNNRGYREIETSMRDVGVEPVGVSPRPPDFLKIAEAYGLPSERISRIDELRPALLRARTSGKPCIIDIEAA